MTAHPQILVAEDDINDLELTERALQRFRPELRVMSFADGAAILDYLTSLPPAAAAPEQQPRLVLLDIKMPRLGGLDVLELLREQGLCEGVPIVVFSSSREPRDLARAYAAQVNSFVRKPGDYARYMETIRQVASYWLDTNVAAAAD